MKIRIAPLLAAALLAAATPARAHFVWISLEKDSSGQPAAHVWFSELAEPDSADLLDKIAATKAWSRGADGKPTMLNLSKHVEGNGGALIGPIDAEAKALGASIKYGVLTRREQTFLLNYYAKYLEATPANLKALGRDAVALNIAGRVR